MANNHVKLRRRLADYFFTFVAGGLSIVVVGALVAVALPVMVAALWSGNGVASEVTTSSRR